MSSVANGVGSLQALILLVLWALSFGLVVWALVDALRQSTGAFPAAGKLTKPIWLGIIVLALALSFVSLGNALSFPNIIAVVAAGVYLADVRPAVTPYRGRGGGAGRSSGPYGPW